MAGARPTARPGNAASDQREALADEREAQANERERKADEREQELDKRGRALGLGVETLEQRTVETIERLAL
jgi:hypothetical protein